jgi:hypothetical protein
MRARGNCFMRILFIVIITVAMLTGCSIQTMPKQSSAVSDMNRHKVVVIVVDSLMDRSIRAAMNDKQFAAIRYLMSHGHYLSHVVASFPSMSVSDLSTVVTGSYPEEHHIPGLVWFDTSRGTIVNYGNNLWQTITLGTRSVSQSALYDLNQTHLSKGVHTIFEDLQGAGYSTGAINMLVYRGRTPHQLTLPLYTRPFAGTGTYTVRGPDTFVLGQLTSQGVGRSKDGIFNKFGLNDDYATDELVQLIKQRKLPDFTMVYLPNNDTVVHKHGVNAMQGIADVDKNLQKILSTYGSWDKTLQNMTLIVMGDGGVTQVFAKGRQPTIFLKNVFSNYVPHRWGKKMQSNDDVAFAVNSRMAYVYLLSGRIRPDDAVKQLKQEKRIDVIAWTDGSNVFVTRPENTSSPLVFHKDGPFTDPYGQTWNIQGDQSLLDMSMGPDRTITYGKYPDALHQLWSAAHCQKGRYMIVTAKKGYQFGDENAPKHNGGAQQASLIDDDVFAPIIINGTNHVLKEPSRFVDLKKYFISIVRSP